MYVSPLWWCTPWQRSHNEIITRCYTYLRAHFDDDLPDKRLVMKSLRGVKQTYLWAHFDDDLPDKRFGWSGLGSVEVAPDVKAGWSSSLAICAAISCQLVDTGACNLQLAGVKLGAVGVTSTRASGGHCQGDKQKKQAIKCMFFFSKP